MSGQEKIYMRFTSSGLVPADPYADSRLKAKNYKPGDIIAAKLSKLRKVGTNKNAHKIGQLMIDHHDSFRHMDAHQALKFIQIKSGVACEFVGIADDVVKLPKSLSFDSMDEGEFHEAIKGICRYISEEYWPELTPMQIEIQAERHINE